MTTENQKVPKRIAQTVLQSLKGGVVPRIGLPYITVGRKNEIQALLRDVDIISEGGAAFRFIVGRYGCGKSFLLQAIRSYVMDRGFIVADADLSPERRLQGTGHLPGTHWQSFHQNQAGGLGPYLGAGPLDQQHTKSNPAGNGIFPGRSGSDGGDRSKNLCHYRLHERNGSWIFLCQAFIRLLSCLYPRG